jgi:hypothetical protein
MSATCVNLAPHDQGRSALAGAPLLAGGLCAAGLAAFLAGWLPLGFSIVTVFLFAGPHNWIEARYFLTRLPPRWGRLRPFFLTAFAGVVGLTVAFAALPWVGEGLAWTESNWHIAQATWNSILACWILALVLMRSRQNPRRDWGWTAPLAFLLVALAWVYPYLWGLALVYAHPLMAFWILDRELKRSRPHWRPAYHLLLLAVPLLLALLWWQLADAPPLPGKDGLTARISQHAGTGLLRTVSSHLLVATHTFLEMLHYGVWVVVIPLVAFRSAPWQPREIPLARRSPFWSRAVVAILILGGLLVLTLWGAFLADYPLTRDVYFTAALLHVLAEVPFLLRAL